MIPRTLKDNIYAVGAIDWDRTLFDALIPLPYGTTYNSYLIKGSEKIALIDTVERIQGAEREVILFGFTCSDPDQIMGGFLNNPERFNVAITRARHKLIIVGSKTLFTAVAQNEESLRANACFKEFVACHPCFDGADISRWT